MLLFVTCPHPNLFLLTVLSWRKHLHKSRKTTSYFKQGCLTRHMPWPVLKWVLVRACACEGEHHVCKGTSLFTCRKTRCSWREVNWTVGHKHEANIQNPSIMKKCTFIFAQRAIWPNPHFHYTTLFLMHYKILTKRQYEVSSEEVLHISSLQHINSRYDGSYSWG